jgi:hypothetical protein
MLYGEAIHDQDAEVSNEFVFGTYSYKPNAVSHAVITIWMWKQVRNGNHSKDVLVTLCGEVADVGR